MSPYNNVSMLPWVKDERKQLEDDIKRYYSTGGKSNLSNVIVSIYRLLEELKDVSYVSDGYNNKLSMPLHDIVATRLIHQCELLIKKEQSFFLHNIQRTIEVLECYSKSLYKYMKHFHIE